MKRHPITSRFKKIAHEKLRVYIRDNPDAYLREIVEFFQCCQIAIRKTLIRLKIMRKKKTMRYYEQEPQKVKEYLEKIEDIYPEKIIYADETGIDKFLYRKYALALRGEKIFEYVKGNKFQRTNIVAAEIGNKISAMLKYKGIMQTQFFKM